MAAPNARDQTPRDAFPEARGPRMVRAGQPVVWRRLIERTSSGVAGRLLVLAVLAAQGMSHMLPCRGCVASAARVGADSLRPHL